jgi:hypothetical protein
MIGRTLTRRLKQLETRFAVNNHPPIFTISFVSPDKTVMQTLVLGPNETRTGRI